MTGTAHPTLIVLDVNETLSDMSPLASAFEEVGAPRAAAPLWFAATLRDGFALGMAGQNAPFLELAKDVLRTVLAPYVADEQHRDAAVESVLGAFAELDTHPDVPDALRDLHEAGIRLVTLSNGSARVAEALLGRAGLTDLVEQLLSVEDAPAWKPDPRAYGYALQRTEVEAERAMLVAAHPWDVDGAARAGLRTAWVNRSGIGYPASFRPADVTVPSLADLPMALTAG
jgi:2-haloacid dehalogenase